MSHDPAALAELALEVGRRAADLLVEGRQRALATVSTKSSATDMVSEMDGASEALIVEGLLAERPDDGIVAEEGSARSSTSGVTWVVDPLDGTTNYLYDVPGWNVSIAAVTDDGTALAGVVLDPARSETFVATRGGGARRDGTRLQISDPPRLSRALLGTGFGYDPARRMHQAEVLTRVIGEVRDIRRGGAAAVDLCWVACGRLDAHYEWGLAPWDLAAGSLVAVEAGAAVLGPPGEAPGADLVVAAHPRLADSLRALVIDAGALGGP